jgi:hypothetical protein
MVADALTKTGMKHAVGKFIGWTMATLDQKKNGQLKSHPKTQPADITAPSGGPSSAPSNELPSKRTSIPSHNL